MQTNGVEARSGRPPVTAADLALFLGVIALFSLVAKIGSGAFVAFSPPQHEPTIGLDPRNLPYYAGRSTLRMFVALFASLVFTLVYGYAAARNRYARRVLVPLLDILQSVPVLGFLSVTVTGFIALFPGSLLGLEAASIFAIFTSQAWNMAFSFYESLRSIPADLSEAAAAYGLSHWERFVKLDVPASAIGLVWNGLMSFGGGWFFVAASEAISVLNRSYTLPGIGSYVAAAIVAKDMHALAWALLTMAIVVFVVDQLFWRPLVAWSDRFRLEQSSSAQAPRSWIYDLLRASIVPGILARLTLPVSDFTGAMLRRATRVRSRQIVAIESRVADRLYNASLAIVSLALVVLAAKFIFISVGLAEFGYVFLLGFYTLLRVFALLVFATIVWTPIGVAIGSSPALARTAQPIALFLASFPANFVFPFATIAFIRYGVPINIGSALLMALGAQWYILFNSIAGAQRIPSDLKEMALDFGLHGRQRWRRLIIPGIFSSWVTGGITASGGAWNASIVAEVVKWGPSTLVASGLGAYIADATFKGDWPRITLGVAVMSFYVVLCNRLIWRRLYALARKRYSL